jgi:hypothetical protein
MFVAYKKQLFQDLKAVYTELSYTDLVGRSTYVTPAIFPSFPWPSPV